MIYRETDTGINNQDATDAIDELIDQARLQRLALEKRQAKRTHYAKWLGRFFFVLACVVFCVRVMLKWQEPMASILALVGALSVITTLAIWLMRIGGGLAGHSGSEVAPDNKYHG